MSGTHIFTLETWFMNRQEDWDCDTEYLLVHEDSRLETRECGSGATFYRDKLRAEFPEANWHDEALSLHRGLMEPRGLAGLDEWLIVALSARFKFKEDRHSVL